MNILITGGTGLIGKELVNSLVTSGHSITILTRVPQKASDGFPSGIHTVKWDGENSQILVGIISETDAVINLAGESIAGKSLFQIFTKRWSQERKNRIIKSRKKIGVALSEAIKSASRKPAILIQSSAVGYYGPHGPETITERSPAGKDFLAQTCKAWEASTEPVNLMGVRQVIIRTGLVLASDGGILPVMLLPYKLFLGGPIGKGNQYIPWIHIKDQVNAIEFLLTTENANGPYNLSAPNPVTNREFGKIAGQVLNRPYWLPLPSLALKMALGEKSTLVLDGQRAIPDRLIENGFKYQFEFLEDALRDLAKE